jgi:hypothetical protein
MPRIILTEEEYAELVQFAHQRNLNPREAILSIVRAEKTTTLRSEQGSASAGSQSSGEVQEDHEAEGGLITHHGTPLKPSRSNSDGYRHMGTLGDSVTRIVPPVVGAPNLQDEDEGDDDFASHGQTPG